MVDDAINMQIALGNIGIGQGFNGMYYHLTDRGIMYADRFNDDMFDIIQNKAITLKRYTLDELKEKIEQALGR